MQMLMQQQQIKNNKNSIIHKTLSFGIANLLKLLKKPRVMLSIFAAGKTQQIIQIIYSQ